MTERLDLPCRYRRQIEELLRTHLPGVEAWAYGSRVNGKSHPGSDLDLALRTPTLKPISDAMLGDFAAALERSNIPHPGTGARLGAFAGEFPPRNRTQSRGPRWRAQWLRRLNARRLARVPSVSCRCDKPKHRSASRLIEWQRAVALEGIPRCMEIISNVLRSDPA